MKRQKNTFITNAMASIWSNHLKNKKMFENKIINEDDFFKEEWQTLKDFNTLLVNYYELLEEDFK